VTNVSAVPADFAASPIPFGRAPHEPVATKEPKTNIVTTVPGPRSQACASAKMLTSRLACKAMR